MSNDPPLSLTLVKSGPIAPHVQSSEEYAAEVAAVQEALATAIASRPVRYDPIGLVLGSLSDLAGTLFKTTRRWERATAAVVEAGQPFPQAERDKLVRDVTEASRDAVRKGVRAEAGAMIRTFDRKAAMAVGACVAGAFVLGSVGTLGVLAATHVGPYSRDAQAGSAWREVEAQNPDPRQALSAAQILTDRSSGRRFYAGVSLWLDPPQAAPAGVKGR